MRGSCRASAGHGGLERVRWRTNGIVFVRRLRLLRLVALALPLAGIVGGGVLGTGARNIGFANERFSPVQPVYAVDLAEPLTDFGGMIEPTERQPISAIGQSDVVSQETDWTVAAVDAEPFPTRPLTLSDVLVLLRSSPQMAALRGNISIALAERTQAGMLPNPELRYLRFATISGDRDAANDPDEWGFTQELLLFGQREAAIRTADMEITATQAEVFAQYADLVVEARRLFATLLVRQEVVRVLSESLEHFEQIEQLVWGRFEGGDVSQYDWERTALEVATFRSRLVGARAARVEAASELAQLLASPDWLPSARGELKPLDANFDYADLAASLAGLHPRIRAAQNREAAARSGMTLARKERLPVPELEMGWWNAQAPTRNHAGALFVGVSVPTLLFDRGQGRISRASAVAIQAAHHRQAVMTEAEAQLQGSIQVLARLRHAHDLYEQQIRQRLPQLQEMAKAGYREGEIGILELLDAANVYVEPQLSYLELLEAVLHAEIDVLSAAGMVEAYLPPP